MTVILIALGAAVGGAVRWWVERRMPPASPGGMPWGTLAVNVIGAFILGIVVTAATEDLKPLLATGLCGALTTFSALGLQLDRQWSVDARRVAASYLALTLVLGLSAAWAGLQLGTAMA